MSNENKPYPSRLKKKKNRSNSILNMMIGLVFALILIVGAFIFLGQDDTNENAQEPESVQIASDTDEQAGEEDNSSEENTEEEKTEESEGKPDEDSAKKDDEDKAEGKEEADKAESEEKDKDKDEEGSVTRGGTITREESKDPVVDETVINTSWEPVGTEQSGDHVSVYQKGHVDWNEKIAAISYATGLPEDDMFIMRVENGGGPQKSIGTVQSKDKSEKYRVHLEWVDGEGWKPVKMDVLKTLKGAY